MRLRLAAVLVVLAVVFAGGAVWAVSTSDVRGDTACGPVALQRNRRFAVCDGFYAARTTWAVVLVAGAGAAAVTAVRIGRAGRRVSAGCP
ncbi:MAG TPA: hypothetical protein VHK88_16850 [Aquihabitans sp.]|jgi:hypothetical protein|nr:hypothetical protein [Aquihabitans sp.]